MFALSRQHLWFAPAFRWQRIELPLALSRRHLNFTPNLALSCRVVLRLRAASPYAPGPNASCVAALAFSQLCQQARRRDSHGVSRPHIPSPSSRRSTPARWTCIPWPSLAITAHLALSCRHTLSGPVSIPSTVCYPEPAIASPCFPARSFVRDGSLLVSRTSSNSQVWISRQQYGRSTYRLFSLGFSVPAPTWKNYPRQSLDVGVITDVG